MAEPEDFLNDLISKLNAQVNGFEAKGALCYQLECSPLLPEQKDEVCRLIQAAADEAGVLLSEVSAKPTASGGVDFLIKYKDR